MKTNPSAGKVNANASGVSNNTTGIKNIEFPNLFEINIKPPLRLPVFAPALLQKHSSEWRRMTI